MDAAGPMAKLRGAIESGTVSPANDISGSIVKAANIIQTARRARISLADVAAQADAFTAPDPVAEVVLKIAFGDDLKGRMSRPKLAGQLANFANEMQTQSGLFGANKSATEVLQEAAQKHGYGSQRDPGP